MAVSETLAMTSGAEPFYCPVRITGDCNIHIVILPSQPLQTTEMASNGQSLQVNLSCDSQ
jgi:hypothetical protein